METVTLKPPALRKGDTVGIISNSAPLAGLVPHRFERGVKSLRELGYQVKIAPSALKVTGSVSASGKERAEDFNNFFTDPEIGMILSCIGGNHTNQMLENIDYELVKKHPKIICGYSDTTVLLEAIYAKTGLVGFYGPSLLNQFGEYPKILSYTKKYFLKATGGRPIGLVKPAAEWTDEFLDWFEKKDLTRARKKKSNAGWTWLCEGKGKVKGKLIGGCLPSLLHLAGTPYWPKLEKAILFWEIPESDGDITRGLSIASIDSYLTDLENIGSFKQIVAMIVGRPYGYNDDEVDETMDLIRARMEKYNFPVLFGVDIGHTDPMITMPIGVTASLNSSLNLFSIDEAATIKI